MPPHTGRLVVFHLRAQALYGMVGGRIDWLSLPSPYRVITPAHDVGGSAPLTRSNKRRSLAGHPAISSCMLDIWFGLALTTQVISSHLVTLVHLSQQWLHCCTHTLSHQQLSHLLCLSSSPYTHGYAMPFPPISSPPPLYISSHTFPHYHFFPQFIHTL